MLIVSKSGEIKLTRGDNVLTFAVKKSYEDNELIIEKQITGSTTFHIEPKDTKGLAFGKYKYDVQITTAAGDNYTFIDKKDFIITEEVG